MSQKTCPWGVGAKTSTLLIPEDEYGVIPENAGTRAVLLPFNSNAVSVSQNTTAPETIRGNRNPVEAIKGNVDVAGDIVAPVDYICFGNWLAASLGNPVTTAVAGQHKHVFKVKDAQPSFTLEKVFPGIVQYIRSVGCKVSTLALSIGGDGELTATVTVMGKNESIEGETISAAPSKPEMKRAQNFQAKLKIGGEEVGIATSFSLNLDFGLDGDTYAIGSNGFRKAICEGLVTASGDIEAFFEDDTYLALAEADAKTSAELILSDGTRELGILLPEIKFARTSPSIDGPAGVKQNLSYNAFYDNSAEQSVVVFTLLNEVENYNLWEG